MIIRLRGIAPHLAGVGLALLLLALAAHLLGSDPKWLPEALLGIGVALIISYALLRPREVASALTGRQAMYGGNALLMSVAFLGILVTLNFLAARYHKRFDLTENKRYTLSQETVQVLNALQEPVKVTGFFTPDDPRRSDVEDLLKEYAYHSDKFTYEFVDPELRPGEARRLGVTSYGVLVFQRGEKRQETFGVDEEDLTSALLKVSRDEQRVIYFTTGHKERDPQSFQPIDYGSIRQVLGRDNYDVKSLNLATITTTIPGDAAVLVVASPQIPFAPEEIDRLDQWLSEGGRLLLLTDPPTPGGEDPMAAFSEMLARWGVRLRNDVALDPVSSFFGDAASPLITRFPFSSITKDLGDPPPEGMTITRLLETTPDSWGETDLTNQQARYDPNADVRGPLVLGAMIESQEKKGRLVVFGDADFVSNNILGSVRGAFGNADLFRNSINWLAEEEALIAISPKPPEVRTLQPLTPVQRNLIFYGSVIFLPLIVLAIGGVVWWQRR